MKPGTYLMIMVVNFIAAISMSLLFIGSMFADDVAKKWTPVLMGIAVYLWCNFIALHSKFK